MLKKMVRLLKRNKEEILTANQRDIEAGGKKALPSSVLDRLPFTASKLQARINSLNKIIE